MTHETPTSRRRTDSGGPVGGTDAGSRPGRGQAEIRQAIDATYLNALNGRDIKTFLAGWDQGAVVASLSPTGEVSFQRVIDFANAVARDAAYQRHKRYRRNKLRRIEPSPSSAR